MFIWRCWNEICWAQTYGTSLTVFITYVEIKLPSLFLKLTTFHKKSSWRGKKKIKCQVYTSIEYTTAAELLWASNYSSTSSEALEKHCSLGSQTDHGTCNQNTSVITALEGSLLCVAALAASCTVQRGSLNCHWLCQLTGAQLEQHPDPETTTTEGLFPPALLTKSILKAYCLPFLAWQKVLACLPCWTSSESWQWGQYLLSWILSLLTIEGEESSWVAHYPAIKSTSLAVVWIRIHIKCWQTCRHTREHPH